MGAQSIEAERDGIGPTRTASRVQHGAGIEILRDEIRPLVQQLADHPLYPGLRSAATLRPFMRTHVFCVWDFMTLLMALRERLTGPSVPWVPRGAAEDRRLINEIVRDEESDLCPDGRVLSHFELYLEAMTEAGADRGPIDAFVAALVSGAAPERALAQEALPPGVAGFVGTTLEIARSGALHVLAAVFYSSREAVIPPIFQRVLESVPERERSRWGCFRFYLERHIEIDDQTHQHAAGRIVERACADDPHRWAEAIDASCRALRARIELWNQLAREPALVRGDERSA